MIIVYDIIILFPYSFYRFFFDHTKEVYQEFISNKSQVHILHTVMLLHHLYTSCFAQDTQ